MTSDLRAQYLKNWSYPDVLGLTLTTAELNQEFGVVVSGGVSKRQDFWLSGRITNIVRSPLSQQVDTVLIEIEQQLFTVKCDKLNEDSQYLVNNILRVHDLIAFQMSWHAITTSGLFPKIEGLHPQVVKLVAPCLKEYTPDNLTISKAKDWQSFLGFVRNVFNVLGFIEVRTQTLVESPGLEPFIDPFQTELKFGSRTKNYYLPTSPEFQLKPFLAQGFSRVFELKPSFRNGEKSEHHEPEFWMLEWYRTHSDLNGLIKDIKGLLNYLKLHWPRTIRGWGPVTEVRIADLFLKYCEFPLTPETSLKELQGLASRLNIRILDNDTWDDVFHRIWIDKIETEIGRTGPVIVRDFPPSQATWAKINSHGWADRAELYWKGLEIGNGFYELNDPNEQMQRFERANLERIKLGKPVMPIPKRLMEALEMGQPPAAGMAIGLDRLYMALSDESKIQNSWLGSDKGEM